MVSSKRNGIGGPELSTDPRQLYVSYLTADELSASLERIDRKLFTPHEPMAKSYRKVLLDIRMDLYRELGRRQLTLLKDSADESR